MPVYTIETPTGRRLTIEAGSEAAALAGARQWQEQNGGSADGYTQPAPPPGEIIHDYGRSYVSDRKEIAANRRAGATERENALAMEALRTRGREAPGVAESFTRKAQPFTQGQSLGFGDELISAIFGLGEAAQGESFGDAYDFGQEFQRQELERQREEQPLTSLALEAAGGLSTGGALARSGVTAIGRMGNRGVRNLAPRIAAGAGEGAAYGTAYGVGTGDGSAGERLADAGDDALIGALFGGAAVPTVDAAMALGGRYVGNLVTALRRPESRAEDMLVQAIMRDGSSPEQIASDVSAAIAAGQPEFAAIDAGGRNVKRLGAIAAKTPGEFRETAAATVAARQQGQGDRIAGYVNEALGDGGTAYQTEQSLLASRRAAAEPLYQQAYRAPAPRGAFYDEMLERRSIQEAIQDAERVAAELQIPLSDLFTEVSNANARTVTRDVASSVLGADGRPLTRMESETANAVIRVPTVRGWDFIKRELDARVNQLYAASDTMAAEAVKETRNTLRQQLADDVPAYRQALARYSDDSAALDAIEAGRNVVRARDPDEALAMYRDLTDGQRSLARVGASRELGTRLDNMRAGQDKTLAFDTPAMGGKLDTLIDDPNARAIFGDRIERERAMVRSNRQMQGGSSTFENYADADALSEGVLAKLARGNVGGAALDAAGRMLGFVGRAAQGMNEDVARRVGDYLLSADPVEIRRLSQAFEAAGQGDTARGKFIVRLIAVSGEPQRERSR